MLQWGFHSSPFTCNSCYFQGCDRRRYYVIYVNVFKIDVIYTEVNISSYPVTPVTGLFFFSRAEIFKLGCFVQKYSDLGVSCRNICQVPFRVTQSEKCILEKVVQMVL